MNCGTDPHAFRERSAAKELLPLIQREDLHQFAFGKFFSLSLPTGQTQNYQVEGEVERVVLVTGRGEVICDLSVAEMEGAPGTEARALRYLGRHTGQGGPSLRPSPC